MKLSKWRFNSKILRKCLFKISHPADAVEPQSHFSGPMMATSRTCIFTHCATLTGLTPNQSFK